MNNYNKSVKSVNDKVAKAPHQPCRCLQFFSCTRLQYDEITPDSRFFCQGRGDCVILMEAWCLSVATAQPCPKQGLHSIFAIAESNALIFASRPVARFQSLGGKNMFGGKIFVFVRYLKQTAEKFLGTTIFWGNKTIAGNVFRTPPRFYKFDKFSKGRKIEGPDNLVMPILWPIFLNWSGWQLELCTYLLPVAQKNGF